VNFSPLPIDEVLPRVVEAARGHSCFVLRAETGAGKTTRVPGALLDAGVAGGKSIVMLEPRRIAAKAAARWMSQERGTRLGEVVGYQVRFEKRTGPRTRIHVVTDGILVRRLQEDPFLEDIGVVLFDEFHERSLNADLALGLVQKVRKEVRPDLKVGVMSATLDVEAIADYLDLCPVIDSKGRLFEVAIEHRAHRREVPLEEKIQKAVGSVLERSAGDVLVFLPGVGEIRRCREELASLAQARDLDLLELYGDLPLDKQDSVLRRGKRRKVILSTNVAETSLTIENVTAVVDSGLVRRLRMNPSLEIDQLELGMVSKASAEQRAGRAGRTAPGVCIRLWSELEQRTLADQEEPEIQRVDLSSLVLQLLLFGERDPSRFPFFEAPPERALAQAIERLRMLGAVDGGAITALGRRMAALPVQPRIARMVLEGAASLVLDRAALAAALLTERDPFVARRTREHPPSSPDSISDSDLVDRVHAIEAFETRRSPHGDLGEIHVAGARVVMEARDQLVAVAKEGGLADLRSAAVKRRREAATKEPPDSSDEALQRCLLAAYPDRLARRREPGSARGVMVGGRGVRLLETSRVRDAELFLCIDIDAGEADTLVRQASAVRLEWLPAEALRTEESLRFNEGRKTVEAVRRTLYADLVLDERQTRPSDQEQVQGVLASAASRDLAAALTLDDADVQGFLVRLRCLTSWMPELSLPNVDEEAIRLLLPALCAGRRSFDELRKAPLLDHLKKRLTHRQLKAFEAHAPERIQVPSGNKIRLQYRDDGPPVLAVRIQEVFGLLETPRVAAGRIPVLIHLLAPNHRVQQITQDLKSFWANTYAQVRKDLRARYPRHSWPEDPLCAQPSRGVRRRS